MITSAELRLRARSARRSDATDICHRRWLSGRRLRWLKQRGEELLIVLTLIGCTWFALAVLAATPGWAR